MTGGRAPYQAKPSREWQPMKIEHDGPISISRVWTFEAGHSLDLGPMHKCTRWHGHSYTLRLKITGKVDETGLVLGQEYHAMDIAMEPVIASVDHHNLNDVLAFPTTESLVVHLAKLSKAALRLPDGSLTARLTEGPRSWAEVSL